MSVFFTVGNPATSQNRTVFIFIFREHNTQIIRKINKLANKKTNPAT